MNIGRRLSSRAKDERRGTRRSGNRLRARVAEAVSLLTVLALALLAAGCPVPPEGINIQITPVGGAELTQGPQNGTPQVPDEPEPGEPPAPPSAASYVVVDTGQTLCYDDVGAMASPEPGHAFYGQDAQFQGVQPAYQDNGDGTVTDLNTGLMWQKTPDLANKSTLAEAVEGAAALGLAGHDDWRLPTIKELYSLMDFSGSTGMSADTSVPYIDTDYFDFAYGDPNVERFIDAQYCSTTQYVSTTMNGSPTVFGVNFADGRIKGYGHQGHDGYEKTFFVRYVRDNPDYGVNDFVDNGDGTVTDRATGLIWTKADSGAGMDWQDALEWVQQRNAEKHLGHGDWRLPNAKELQSIVDYARAPAVTGSAAIDPVFEISWIIDEGGLTNYPCFWTSTTHVDGPPDMQGAFAVYVAFGEALGYMASPWGSYELMDVHGAGAQRSDPKAGDPADWPYGHGPQGDVRRIYNHVRCVRGGAATEAPPTAPPEAEPPSPPDDELPPPPDGANPPAFEDLDLDGDGVLSLQEALAIPEMTEQVFDDLDANSDGFLSKEELPPPPGEEPPPPPNDEEPPTFEDLDLDGDGLLSLQEALAIPQMTEQVFDDFDANGDGLLSKEELPPPPPGGELPPPPNREKPLPSSPRV